MTSGLARASRRLAAGLLALSVCGLPAALGADSVLPVVLEEVSTGRPVELAAGAVALHLVFFAPWCPPCMDELEPLAELEERWAARGYRVVLIAVRNRNSRERLLRFTEQHGPPGKIYLDVNGEAEQAFGAAELPAHVLLDATGAEVGRWAGLGDSLEVAVRKLLLSPAGGS